MCTSIRRYRQEGENLGKQEGMKLGEKIGKSKGIKIGMIETLKLLINNQLGYISEEITNLLNKSNEEQLQTLTLSIMTIHNEEEVIQLLS